MAATADDYGWIHDQFEEEMEHYCITLVAGLTCEELLDTFDAKERVRYTGVRALTMPSAHAEVDRGLAMLPAVACGDWSMLVEINGLTGIFDERIPELSRGRTVVVHHSGVAWPCLFRLYRDGELRVSFDQYDVREAEGSHPTELLPDILEAGYDLRPWDEEGFHMDWGRQLRSGFALAERLTGVRPTAEMFESAQFLCGLIKGRF